MSTYASMPIPIILCGKTVAVGDSVAQLLKPDYEVIRFITSPSEGAAEIPQLLRSQKAVAVVTGGAYDDTAIDEMRAGVSADVNRVPWLRLDMSKSTPPLGPQYAKAMVERLRGKLGELFDTGPEPGAGVYWY